MIAMVHFGNVLSSDEFCDDAIRAETFRNGMERLSGIPEVDIYLPLPNVCCAGIKTTNVGICEVELEFGEECVTRDADKPAFRAS